jgi:hypothetical protein
MWHHQAESIVLIIMHASFKKNSHLFFSMEKLFHNEYSIYELWGFFRRKTIIFSFHCFTSFEIKFIVCPIDGSQ